LLRGQSQELAPDKVATLRAKLGLEDGTPVHADADAGDRPAQGGEVDAAFRQRSCRRARVTSRATTRRTKDANCAASTTCAKTVAAVAAARSPMAA
jgi:hypothetical protein